MTRPTIDDAVAALEKIAEDVTELGIERVAKEADLKDRIVRKFVKSVMESKNSDIRKISQAVQSLKEQN